MRGALTELASEAAIFKNQIVARRCWSSNCIPTSMIPLDINLPDRDALQRARRASQASSHNLGRSTSPHIRIVTTLCGRSTSQAAPGRADYQGVSLELMGDLLRDLGESEEARQAFARLVAIKEHRAQAEPSCADRQRDLSLSLVKMSKIEPARAREYLSRAFHIACSLRDYCRLALTDASLVDDLAHRLSELQDSTRVEFNIRLDAVALMRVVA
jgi:hypothetical protein